MIPPPKPTFIEVVSRDKYNNRKARFRCSCGILFVAFMNGIESGQTKSCGCWKKLVCRITGAKLGSIYGPRSATHGDTRGWKRTPEYRAWTAMKYRCALVDQYPRWGGRGIRVCDRWLDKKNGFKNFVSDMGRRPPGRYSIDRIDNDGHYEPSNCRWATIEQQMLNKSTIRMIEFRGETKPMAHWAKIFRIPHETFRYRISRGMSVEKAAKLC